MKTEVYKIHYDTTDWLWWYRVRNEMVKSFIQEYKTVDNPSILDVGCGVGRLLAELKNFGYCYGIDCSEEAIKFCQKGGITNIKIGNAACIPYNENFFNFVLALDMLEHIDDDLTAIKEMKRVLKPGGKLIIFVPAFNFLWGNSDELGKHYRRYILKDLERKISLAGLKTVKASYFNFFLFLPILLVRLAVRFFRIPVKSEAKTGFKFVNSILYIIFSFENFLLKYINFPFGVSAMIIAEK